MKTDNYIIPESPGGQQNLTACRRKQPRWFFILVISAAASILLGMIPLKALGNVHIESAFETALQSPLPGEFPHNGERFLAWIDNPRRKTALSDMRTSIRAQLEYLTTNGRPELQRRFARAEPHLPSMKRIFREEGLPEDLVYVALIESGFELTAVSGANAVGPWQFTIPTARSYGLRIDRWVDERRDLLKSTNAAARYLKDLYERFGSWPLALASYNTGPTRVRQAMRNNNSSDFWHLKALHQIHKETRHYVPRFIAYSIIAGNRKAFGFSLHAVPLLEHDEVLVGRSADLHLLALSSGVSYEAIRGLNPEIRRGKTPPDQNAYRIRLPKGARTIIPAALAPTADERQVRWMQPDPEGQHISAAPVPRDHTNPLPVHQGKVIGSRKTAAPPPPAIALKSRTAGSDAVLPAMLRTKKIARS